MSATPHILLVDDHDQVRSLMAIILAGLYPTARISSVADGLNALTLCATEPIDLLITDGHMIPISGPALIRTLRADGFTFPILLLSMEQAFGEVAEELGADAFLAKPFSIKELERVLDSLLGSQNCVRN